MEFINYAIEFVADSRTNNWLFLVAALSAGTMLVYVSFAFQQCAFQHHLRGNQWRDALYRLLSLLAACLCACVCLYYVLVQIQLIDRRVGWQQDRNEETYIIVMNAIRDAVVPLFLSLATLVFLGVMFFFNVIMPVFFLGRVAARHGGDGVQPRGERGR